MLCVTLTKSHLGDKGLLVFGHLIPDRIGTETHELEKKPRSKVRTNNKLKSLRTQARLETSSAPGPCLQLKWQEEKTLAE